MLEKGNHLVGEICWTIGRAAAKGLPSRRTPQGHDQTPGEINFSLFPTCGSRKSAKIRLATEL